MKNPVYVDGLVILIVAPIALVWDIAFLTVKTVYEGMCYVDKKGEKFIESLLNR